MNKTTEPPVMWNGNAANYIAFVNRLPQSYPWRVECHLIWVFPRGPFDGDLHAVVRAGPHTFYAVAEDEKVAAAVIQRQMLEARDAPAPPGA